MTPTKLIINIIHTLLSVIRVLLSSSWKTALPSQNHKSLHILGNGPSLSEVNIEYLEGDLLAVNNFALSDKYVVLKPGYYIINAPEYWIKEVDEEYKKMRNQLQQVFITNTNWNMCLLVPFKAKNSTFVDLIINQNSNIKVYFYNTTAVEGISSITHYLYNIKLGMPRPHNVLIPSILVGIWMKYKIIYLHGADHSWLKEIFVNRENTVFLTQKHFYDNHSAKPDVMKKLGKGQRKLHEILEKFYLTFKGYHEINTFAKSQGVTVLNQTKESFIDAFEKIDI